MFDRDSLLQLYGSDERPQLGRRMVAGSLSIEITNGVVRGIFWGANEILRTIDYPIRNSDWGTNSAITLAEDFRETPTSLHYSRRFFVAASLVTGDFTCTGHSHGLVEATLHLRMEGDTVVNRAGFVILHPVAHLSGSQMQVTHSNGSVEVTEFPLLIAPSQPVSDIAALRQEGRGVVVEIVFAGDVFEMEDQRNWSDASFKTYCRPLALPYPYQLAAGETVSQSLTVNVTGDVHLQISASSSQGVLLGPPTGRNLPELALALEVGWEGDPRIRRYSHAKSTLLRADLTEKDWRQNLDQLVAVSVGALDLELIVSDDLFELDAQLAALAKMGLAARSLVVLPKSWLRSYQPDGIWPTGASPSQAASTARSHFPRCDIGGGVLTNFTELNRHREAAHTGDFLTHGTTAIVHAADDHSVMQTLEALPQVFASAEALAPEKPYRLGLLSIGMRSNPYGRSVAPNPESVRRPMAMIDPRHGALFGAAWMVGVMASTASTRIDRMSLAAIGGPFGLFEGDQTRPCYHVHEAFVHMGGRRRLEVGVPAGIAAVAVEGALLVANLGTETRALRLPAPGRTAILEKIQASPDWLRTAARVQSSTLTLPPLSIAFVDMGPTDLFGRTP